MKKLILLNENTDIKLNDTGTIIQFKAQNDGQPVSISNGQTATFRIKNDFGFVKSVKASSSYGGYVFELDTADLSGLVVGSYQVELLIQKDADDALIFPDTAFVGFNITANALTITGEQLPMMSLDEFKNELKTYVDDQTASAETAIKSDFQSYVDDLSDSTIATANKASEDAQTAITTADGAVDTANTAKSTADSAVQTANGATSTAQSAVNTANTAKSTADTASSKADNAQSTANDAINKTNANATLISTNSNSIKSNSDSINGGLYLDRTKSYAQVNSSKNLVVNSEMQSKDSNNDPYADWHGAWGWTWSDSGNLISRKDWYGYNALQLGNLSPTANALSTAICAGAISKETVYSVRFHYRVSGTWMDGQKILAYLEYAYQSDFVGSQKILVGEINSTSSGDAFIIKENITVPKHMDWIRLRLEMNMERNGSNAYIWFAQPMINYGATIQDYVISDLPGQRIAEIESNLATVVLQTMQSGTDLNSVKNTGNWELKGVALTNTPVSSTLWGILSVTSINNGTNGSQLLTDTNTNKMYRRCWNSSNNFTSWVEM